MLAEMGAAFGLVADRPIDQNQRDLKEMQVTRLALVKHRTRLLNRLQTLTLAFTKRQTNARLNQITAQPAALEAEIQARRKACPEPAQASEILRSIPGIGAVSAAAILIECPEIGTMTAKQIASLAGLAPMTRQSGQWRGKAFIQGGRKHLRDFPLLPLSRVPMLGAWTRMI